MKNRYLIFFLISFTLFSCSNEMENKDESVAFVDISGKANWESTPDEVVVIINSQDELKNYYTDIEGETPLKIDFNTKTVLMVSGATTNGISNKTLEIKQIKDNLFLMNASIYLDYTFVAQGYRWIVACSKLPKDAKVTYSVSFNK